MSQLQKPRTARFPIIEFLLLFSSLLSLSLEVSAFGLFVAFFRKVGDEHRVVKHPLRSLLPYWKEVVLGTLAMGITYTLFYVLSTWSLSYGVQLLHSGAAGAQCAACDDLPVRRLCHHGWPVRTVRRLPA